MSSSDNVILKIESIAATGSGFARIGADCYFTDYTAPGDIVRVCIVDEGKGWYRGELLEILEPSPERTEPLCPMYKICGGCNFQHLNYETQLNAKKEILQDCFRRIGGINPPEIRVKASPQWEYRNRVQFHCAPENRKKLGFTGKKSRTVVHLTDCPVLDPGIRSALKTNSLFPPPQKDRFNVFSRDDLFLSEGGKCRGNLTLGRQNRQNMRTDAGVFFQSNCGILEVLLEDLEILAKNCDAELLFGDIYCGVGTFSVFLGNNFTEIELVEENKTALALARENTAQNYKYYSLGTDEWIKRRQYNEKKWGLMVVDPPRTGLSGAMRKYLTGCLINTLAYVSCEPATLARDSGDLTAAGFILKELNLYDFYPQTSHIESMAVFMKGNPCE